MRLFDYREYLKSERTDLLGAIDRFVDDMTKAGVPVSLASMKAACDAIVSLKATRDTPARRPDDDSSLSSLALVLTEA